MSLYGDPILHVPYSGPIMHPAHWPEEHSSPRPLDLGENSDNSVKSNESSAGDGTKAQDHLLSGHNLAFTLLACFITLFILALDQTIVTTIFSTVGNKFHGFDKILWLTTAFVMPMAVLSPSYGNISIAFGRKNTLLGGIIVFEVGSLIAALASSMGNLIGGRVVQGLGAGAIQTVVAIIISESVPLSHRPWSLMILATSYSIASVLGPFVGGAFTTHVSWRWCFYINLPLGAMAWALLFVGFHPPAPKGRLWDRAKRIDVVGIFQLVTALVLILLGLSLAATQPWVSPGVLLCLILGGLFFTAFWMWDLIVSKNPVFLKQFLVTPQIICSALAGFCSFAFFLGNITYLTVYFQIIFGHSAFQLGIDLLPIVMSVTLAAVFNGVLIKVTRQIKLLYVFSGVCGVIGCGLLLLLKRHTPTSHRIGYLIIMGISTGMQVQCTLLSCQLKAPKGVTGSLIKVTNLVSFCRFFGGAMGATTASLVFNSLSSKSIEKILNLLPDKVKEELVNVSPAEFLNSPAYIAKLPQDIQNQIYDKIMLAITGSFYLGLGYACAGLVLCLFGTNQKFPKDPKVLEKAI